MVQGRRETFPNSAVMSGRAAAIPRAWNEARAAVAKIAIDTGSNSREKMLRGSVTV